MSTSSPKHIAAHDAAECAFCRNVLDFELPNHLLEELNAGRVVIFAGAGISTEGANVYPYTFYEDVAQELGVSPKDGPSFPELMTRYCAQPNGRAKLLRKIRDRFQYISAFPELYGVATRFHRELSTLFLIDSVITTNWDDYFEQECGATPFVTAEDFTFWSTPGRKVFKIHGSINSLGSIVATSADYEACYERLQKGLLGSNLKVMLATKTVVYVGYSLRDDDLLRILTLLRQEMGELFPHGYIVTLDHSAEDRLRELGLTPIITDASHFVSILKEHVIADGHMLQDSRFTGVAHKLFEVREEHRDLYEKLNIKEHPEVLYAGSYQDGLIHAFERILALRNTSQYSHICDVVGIIQSYEPMRRERLRAKQYGDVAYIEGYMNGLIFLLEDDQSREALPLYYVFGAADQPATFEDFDELRQNASQLHKTAHRVAERRVAELGDNLLFHHRPFLF